MLWLGTALSLIAGFAALAQGATTAPAVLLVLGYAVLAPLAILGRRAPRATTGESGTAPGRAAAAGAERTPYGAALVVALTVLLLYRLTLAPTTAMWDASEYIAAAKVLGLPHPPGNPMFILIAHLFGLLPLARSYAERINLLAATASALSAGLWFLFAHEITRRMFTAPWMRVAAAAACAVLGATCFTVWNQSVVNEKVYTVALAQMTVVVWLLARWLREDSGGRADGLLLVIAYLLALGYTNHPAGYLAAPCVMVAVVLRSPATLLRRSMIARVVAVTLFGLTPFAFEPIRSAHHPIINEGEPTGCTQGFAIGCTLSRTTAVRLKANLAREQYGKPSLSERQAPFGAQIGLWWLYFRWQWLRDPTNAHTAAQLVLALLAATLAAIGARTHARLDRDTFWPFAALIGTVTVALVFYLNFKYGYSQSPELGGEVPREVRDRDYFFLWSFSALAIWVGIGFAWCWQQLARAVRRPDAFALTAPVMAAMVLFPLAVNWRHASRAGETFTRDFAFDMLDSVAQNAVLITAGDNDTFPLWYAQEVEGHRKDVVVIISTYLGTDWFPRQLLRRGVAVATSPEEADTIPEYVQLPSAQIFESGGIRATVPAGVLTRDQLFMLRIVRDVLPTRPVYFTNAFIPRTIGLDPYLVSEGLALRLSSSAPVEGSGIVHTARGFVDVDRSFSLWKSGFRGPAAFRAGGDWADAASLAMPAQYVLAGVVLAEALDKKGNKEASAAVDSDVRSLLATGGLNRIFAQ